MPHDDPTTTNGATPTNGTTATARPLDLRTCTRTLARYAMSGEPVCVISERRDGVMFVAIGKVVVVSDRIAIVSRRDEMVRRPDVARPERYDGESFVSLAAVTRIEPAPRAEPLAAPMRDETEQHGETP